MCFEVHIILLELIWVTAFKAFPGLIWKSLSDVILPVYFYSEATLKKAPGNKLTKSASLPGQNGNPTFAAVAAGYDKSPGECVY